MASPNKLNDSEYVALADLRFCLRQFLAFSERHAASLGLTPQQHQALLAIRGAASSSVSVGYVAERLILKPHSATGLIDRLESLGLVRRRPSSEDGRQALLELTSKAHGLLDQLSKTHREEIVRLRPTLAEVLGRFG